MVAILTSVRWHLIVLFISISLVISDTELPFLCLLAVCLYVFFGERSIKVFHPLDLIFCWWCSLILSCVNCLYVLETSPLSVLFANIFSHSVGFLFVLCGVFFFLMVYFAVQKLLSLIRSHLFSFVFIFITLGGGSKKILLLFMPRSIFPVFL